MKKLLSIVLAALVVVSCLSLTAFASEDASLEAVAGDCKVTLSWDDTDDESYTVYWKRSSSETWKLAGTVSKNKVNITGLTNGVSYDFRVKIGDGFTEIVTAVPAGETVAILEYYGDGVYSEYTISDESSAEKLILAYESLEYNTSEADGKIASPYYKVILSDYYGDFELYVSSENLILLDDGYCSPDDGTDYYSLLSDVANSLTPTVSVEMPCSADDFDYITIEHDEEGDGLTTTFTNETLKVNSYLALYYSLEYITEPTDAELVNEAFMGIDTISFELDGESHYFSIDCFATVTWDGADGNYTFSGQNGTFAAASGYAYYDQFERLIKLEEFDSEVTGTATLEFVSGKNSETYETSDPDDLDNLRIICESLEHNTESSDEALGDSYCRVTLTVDGEETEFLVSESNIISLGGKAFSAKYGTDYYSELSEIAEASQKQYRGMTVKYYGSRDGQDTIKIEDEEIIEYLVSLCGTLEEVTEPTDEAFTRPDFFIISYRDNGVEMEFYLNKDNLVQSETLGDGTFAMTDGKDYYSEMKEVVFYYPTYVVKQVVGELSLEPRYTVDDLDEIYATETYYSEECIEEDWSIIEDEQAKAELLDMYYALEQLTEPTDETMERVVTRGIVFYVDGTKYSFTLDENNIITWYSADGGCYRFTDDRVDYYAALKRFL
ncbi:MAG: fibronectin type III domain-containing protein [Oscillospiraceae bacterium]|nr:fibronectin type III domain-containing protein [Oscillospiraceae bacterium]